MIYGTGHDRKLKLGVNKYFHNGIFTYLISANLGDLCILLDDFEGN